MSDVLFDAVRACLIVGAAVAFLFGGLPVLLPLPLIAWEMVGDVPEFLWEYLAWAWDCTQSPSGEWTC
jgi:hypothetical protein